MDRGCTRSSTILKRKEYTVSDIAKKIKTLLNFELRSIKCTVQELTIKDGLDRPDLKIVVNLVKEDEYSVGDINVVIYIPQALQKPGFYQFLYEELFSVIKFRFVCTIRPVEDLNPDAVCTHYRVDKVLAYLGDNAQFIEDEKNLLVG